MAVRIPACARERVIGIGGQVPALGGVAKERAAGFQNEADAVVSQRPASGVIVPVWRNLQAAQVSYEAFDINFMSVLAGGRLPGNN
jgi:hypothetical protein